MLMLNLENQQCEVEMSLPGKFSINPASRGAIKAIPGVVDVHDL